MREVVIGSFPVTIIGEEKCTPGSDVLLAVLVHGRTRSKKTTARFANLLLESIPNLVCAVWDLPNHGERTIDASLNNTWQEGNPLHVVQLQAAIDQGSMEAATILHYLQVQLKDLKVRGKVIIGTSLGGYIAWRVAADYRHLITAAVPVISSPNVLEVMEIRWNEFKASAKEPIDEKVSFPPFLKEYMRANAKRADDLRRSTLPIFAICGSDDPLVPPQCTMEWAKNAGPNHRLEVIPGVKHEVPREMIDLTAEYLIRLVTHLGN